MLDFIKNEINAIYYIGLGIGILIIGGVMSDSITNIVDRIFKR